MRSFAPSTTRFLVFSAILALLGAFFYSTQMTLENLVSHAPIEHSDDAESEPASVQTVVEEDIHLPFSILAPDLPRSLSHTTFPSYLYLLPQNLSTPLIRPPEHT